MPPPPDTGPVNGAHERSTVVARGGSGVSAGGSGGHVAAREGNTVSAYPQIVLLSIAVAFGPMLYLSIQNLGGAGQATTDASAAGNAALFAMFTVSSLLAGPLLNTINSPRAVLSIGGLFHVLYVMVLWGLAVAELGGSQAGASGLSPSVALTVLVAASALLGFVQGPYWTVHANILMAYPTPSDRGEIAATGFQILNVFAILISAVPILLNLGASGSDKGGVSPETYLAGSLLVSISFIIPMLMAPVSRVRRSDGSRVEWVTRRHSLASEVLGVVRLFGSKEVLATFPIAFAQGTYNALLWNHLNHPRFTVRTRALNACLRSLVGVLSLFPFGRLLDHPGWGPRMRGLVGAAGYAVAVLLAAGGGLVVYFARGVDGGKIDWADQGAWWYVLCYSASGLMEVHGVFTIWLLSHLTTSPATLSRYSGFRNFCNGSALSLSFLASATNIPAWLQAAWSGGWCLGALVPVYYLIRTHIAEDESYEPLPGEISAAVVEPGEEEVDVGAEPDLEGAGAGGDNRSSGRDGEKEGLLGNGNAS
ncbi:hypothetical protein HDU93_005900 [Gonapodya sp. JEL0774]|nr:hypothetical protein HDU93_005900 [Gonapodya sp. JEL0774]